MGFQSRPVPFTDGRKRNSSLGRILPRPFAAGAILALSLAVGALARASDGVIEINQSCATNGGCFAGDAAGFPVTINQSGSYRLTGNLSTGVATATAIQIAAASVTLDLGGFVVSGTNACSGYPVTSCTASSSTVHGISADANQFLVTVRNGGVVGMGGSCIALLGASSVVEDVRVLNCGQHGIQIGSAGRVRDSFAGGAVSNGVSFGGGSAIAGCETRGNGNSGINGIVTDVHVGSIFENRVMDNGSYGIASQSPVLVGRNALSGNGLPNFNLVSGSRSLGDNSCNGVGC